MGKMQCFVSHCSDDRELVLGLDVILKKYYSDYDFFNTSKKDNALYAGEGRGEALRAALGESEVLIAIITDSYLRSTICISEISAFWFKGKPIIPLVYTRYGVDFLKELLGQSIIHINLYDKTPEKISTRAEEMIRSFENIGFWASDRDGAKAAFNDMFLTLDQARPTRCYIASKDEFEGINRYCHDFGVSRITNTSLPSTELISKLEQYQKIYIVSTTGANLIQTLAAQFIPGALAEGKEIYVLIPNRNSDFIKDVAEVESPNESLEHEKRFEREYNGVIYNLKECIRRAESMKPGCTGKIYIGCTYTMLRQTITLAVGEKNVWGWMSVTLPPKRTVDGTPSFEFTGETMDKTMADIVYGHVKRMMEVADRRGRLICLSEDPQFEAFDLDEVTGPGVAGSALAANSSKWNGNFEEAEQFWSEKRDLAMRNGLRNKGRHHLIEVAAQHPLLPDGTPDVEFAARLDRAVLLYQELVKQDPGVKIYVPGSVHCYKGEADICSLSESGKNYLIRKGIPEEAIFGEETNQKYKGDDGVYNTSDECYVAVQIFNNGNYKKIHCVCSPNQIMRKKLFYLAFGVIPYFYTVSTDEMAHDDIYEIFHSIPNILFKDHDWQGKDSEDGNRTRKERDPKYQQ